MSRQRNRSFNFNDLGFMALRIAFDHENDQQVQHYILDEYEAALQRTAVRVEEIKTGDRDDSNDLAFKRILFGKIRPYIDAKLTELINTLILKHELPFSSMPIETFVRYFDRSIEMALDGWRARGFLVDNCSNYTILYRGPGSRESLRSIGVVQQDTSWGYFLYSGLSLEVEPRFFKACYDQMEAEVKAAMGDSNSN